MFCTSLTLYQEDILVFACTVFWERIEKSKLFAKHFCRRHASSIPARSTQEEKPDQLDQEKVHRWDTETAAAKQKAMLFCIFLQHPSQRGNLVVVGTRSLSSGLDPNEKSQGYLSNTNGDSRHTSNILDSSQSIKHSKWIHLALDTNQLTFEANISTSRNDYIFHFFGVAHKHRSLVSWSWLVLRNTKLDVGKCSNVCILKSSISQV